MALNISSVRYLGYMLPLIVSTIHYKDLLRVRRSVYCMSVDIMYQLLITTDDFTALPVTFPSSHNTWLLTLWCTTYCNTIVCNCGSTTTTIPQHQQNGASWYHISYNSYYFKSEWYCVSQWCSGKFYCCVVWCDVHISTV